MKISKLNLLFAIAALLAVFNSSSFSQSIGLGLEGGINIGNISVTPDFSPGTRTGFMVGGFADFGVSPVIAIRPGIRYISKGFTGTNNITGVSFTDRMNYMEIPLLLKVSIPLPRVRPYFTAGPTLGIQLSASEELTNGQQVQNSDMGTAWETIDFGLYFGGGLDFHVADNTDVFTGFGYSLGLSNFSKVANLQAKNYGIQFTSGVKFHL